MTLPGMALYWPLWKSRILWWPLGILVFVTGLTAIAFYRPGRSPRDVIALAVADAFEDGSWHEILLWLPAGVGLIVGLTVVSVVGAPVIWRLPGFRRGVATGTMVLCVGSAVPVALLLGNAPLAGVAYLGVTTALALVMAALSVAVGTLAVATGVPARLLLLLQVAALILLVFQGRLILETVGRYPEWSIVLSALTGAWTLSSLFSWNAVRERLSAKVLPTETHRWLALTQARRADRGRAERLWVAPLPGLPGWIRAMEYEAFGGIRFGSAGHVARGVAVTLAVFLMLGLLAWPGSFEMLASTEGIVLLIALGFVSSGAAQFSPQPPPLLPRPLPRSRLAAITWAVSLRWTLTLVAAAVGGVLMFQTVGSFMRSEIPAPVTPTEVLIYGLLATGMLPAGQALTLKLNPGRLYWVYIVAVVVITVTLTVAGQVLSGQGTFAGPSALSPWVRMGIPVTAGLVGQALYYLWLRHHARKSDLV